MKEQAEWPLSVAYNNQQADITEIDALTAANASAETIRQWLSIQRAPSRIRGQLCCFWANHDEGELDPFARFPPDNVLEPLAEVPQAIIRNLADVNANEVTRALDWLGQSPAHRILTWGCTTFPFDVTFITPQPLVLFTRGDLRLLQRPSISIVGSRHASPSGVEQATLFSRELAQMGWVICSGGAIGVDGAAHRAALSATGATIAVLGSGIDQLYPARNRQLLTEIGEKGLILSEYAPGTPARSEQFPLRNRIIAGLSCGVLVVEAAERSGSLHTAQSALDCFREVYAIPGSPMNPLAAGPNMLIQQGARLVTKPEDIDLDLQANVEAYEMMFGEGCCGDLPNISRAADVFDENEWENALEHLANAPILASVGFETTSIDAIIGHSGMTVSEVMHQLISLELDGWIKTVPGGYVRVRR